MSMISKLILSVPLMITGAISFPATSASSPTDAMGVRTVYASAAGAALDSNLTTGGGTDDTAALQAILNRASAGKPVHLIIDGAALVSGLDIYGNTTLECVMGGGLYLKDGSARAIVRNAHRSRGHVTDEHIVVRGCLLNGNRDHERGAMRTHMDSHGLTTSYVSDQEEDGTYISGLEFFGIQDLTLQDVTIWKVRAHAVWITNGQYIRLSNVRVDNGSPAEPDKFGDRERVRLWDEYANTDGIHFNGPIRYVTINGLTLRSGDDALAFNANDGDSGPEREDLTVHNDMGPYIGQGPITDVNVSDVLLVEASLGFRFYSSNQRIDRISISNVIGTVQMRMAVLGHHTLHTHKGNFGAITFNNVNVDAMKMPSYEFIMETTHYPEVVRNMVRHEMPDLMEYPLFALDSPIESLNLNNITTRVVDGRPLILAGDDAVIQRMSVGLNVIDPLMQSVPIELKAGSHIRRLSLSLDWIGDGKGSGKNPILNEGGSIDELRWGDTHG